MTKVKICGITSAFDAKAVSEAGADFLGVVLSPSPRRVELNRLATIIEVAGERSPVVGVFATEADLLHFNSECSVSLDYYQVYFDYAGLPVRPPRSQWIRSFRIASINDRPGTASADLLLLDFKNSGAEATREVPLTARDVICERTFIAGNLTVDNVAGVVQAMRPFGVDVARGTESSPGVKDFQLVEQFIRRARNA